MTHSAKDNHAPSDKLAVSTAEIKHLRRCYVRDLKIETQASLTVRDSMRKMVAILDELIQIRKGKHK